MKKQTAPEMRPERRFLRASLRSMAGDYIDYSGGPAEGSHVTAFGTPELQPRVGHHRPEEQGQVGEGEQVEAQGGAPVGAAVQGHRAGHEHAAQHQR